MIKPAIERDVAPARRLPEQRETEDAWLVAVSDAAVASTPTAVVGHRRPRGHSTAKVEIRNEPWNTVLGTCAGPSRRPETGASRT